MGREQRLIVAMKAIVAEQGYAGASVANVIERAGVSRTAFYGSFANREDCFLATYRQILERVWKSISSAARERDPVAQRVKLERLIRAAGEDPAAARLVLVEAHAGPAAVRAEHERALTEFDRIARRLLAGSPPATPILHLPPSALVGALTASAADTLAVGRPESFPTRLEDLLFWLSSYESRDQVFPKCELWPERGRQEPDAQLPRRYFMQQVELLPRGNHALPLDEVATRRQDRILGATAEVVARRGYADATVADITSAARVPRDAFYAHFRCKGDAFDAVQTAVLQQSIAAAAAQFALGSTWPERVWRGLAALLRFVSERPAMAYLAFAEPQAAGPDAIARSQASLAAYTLFLEDGYRCLAPGRTLPNSCSSAIAGAIRELVRREIVLGREPAITDLLPALAYMALAPFLGVGPTFGFIEKMGGSSTGGFAAPAAAVAPGSSP